MPLNLSISDGEFTPYLKYNAKAGRFYVRPEGGTQDVEVMNPRLAFDMANIKTGWLYYSEGQGPEKVWDPSPAQMAPRPAGPRKFKRGFEVMVYGADAIAGIGQLGLREFSSTATNVITALLQMYSEYEAGMRANPESVPFYACTGVKPISGAYGTNYEPMFTLKSWVPRARIPAFDAHTASSRDTGDYGTTSNAMPDDDRFAPPVQSDNALDDEIPF